MLSHTTTLSRAIGSLRKNAAAFSIFKSARIHDKTYWEEFVHCIRCDTVKQKTVTVQIRAEICNKGDSIQKEGSTTSFSSLTLPGKLPWPTFMNNKQLGAFSTDLYLRRDTLCDQTRREETLKWLRQRFTVAWLGNPGTGKTTDYNDIIRTVLRDLGKENGWENLVFKNERENYTIFSSEKNGEVKVDIKEWVGRMEFKTSLKQLDVTTTLLINELHEDESDGDTSCIPVGMAMLLSLSTRDAGVVMKTLSKGMRLCLFYVDLPGDEVCTAMVQEMVHHAPLSALVPMLEMNKSKLPQDAPKEASAEEVRRALLNIFEGRQKQVGPILRSILSPLAFEETMDYVMDPTNIPVLINSLRTWNIRNNPQEVRHFAAARLRPETTNPDITSSSGPVLGSRAYTLQVHSNYLRNLIRTHVSMNSQLAQLDHDKYEFALLESYARDSQHCNSEEVAEWKWFADPGPKDKITNDMKLLGKEIPALPRWTKKGRLPHVVVKCDVKELEAERLYVPQLHNHHLYDHFTVRAPTYNSTRELEKLGTVFLVQCTNQDFKDHFFSESTLLQVLSGLKLEKEHFGKDYEVMLVCLHDKSTPGGHGAAIRVPLLPKKPRGKKAQTAGVRTEVGQSSGEVPPAVGKEIAGERKFQDLSVARWAQTKQAQRFARVTSVMVRVPAFPLLPEFVLP